MEFKEMDEIEKEMLKVNEKKKSYKITNSAGHLRHRQYPRHEDSLQVHYILIFVSLFNFINFILLIIEDGFKSLFNYSRLLISILFLLFVQFNNKIHEMKIISNKLKIFLYIILIFTIFFLIFFIFISILVLRGYNLTINKNQKIDYLIILGNHLNNNEPSGLLKNRLDKSIEYYNEHKNIKLIVSGGNTGGNITEAEVMRNYLMKNCDITIEQIILEDESQNTVQNFRNILKKLKNDKNYGLCSSNSHIYRAYGLAKKLGFDNLYPLSAKGRILTFFGDIIREFYCIIFAIILGNMKLYLL